MCSSDLHQNLYLLITLNFWVMSNAIDYRAETRAMLHKALLCCCSPKNFDSRLAAAQRKMNQVLKKAGVKGQMCIIVILTAILIILFLIAFM